MSRVHRADWVLPIDAPPIRNGWVEIDRGRIVALGNEPAPLRPGSGGSTGALRAKAETSDPEPRAPNPDGLLVILPALVNAHTHLELSWMRGRIEPGDAMPAWATRLIGERGRDGGAGAERQRRDAISEAIAELRETGTGLVGDVGNTLEACGPLVNAGMPAVIFHELLGFRAADPRAMVDAARQRLASVTEQQDLRPAIVPHAPYSVSPALFRSIAAAAGDGPMSVHLGESREEVRFLRDGSGAWRGVLEHVGAWDPDWIPPACGPVEYVARLGLLNDRLLAVHGVQFGDDDLRRLAAAGATVVTCPRSNRWTGAGVPPIDRFYESGVRVAIGTDSLASVGDLNLFNEMAAVRQIAPKVPARRILKSATLDGATALGFGPDLGSIAVGKRAALIAVRVPPDVEDVEEYLVGGIDAARVDWI